MENLPGIKFCVKQNHFHFWLTHKSGFSPLGHSHVPEEWQVSLGNADFDRLCGAVESVK